MIVLWKNKKFSRETVFQELQIIIVPGSDPADEEHIAFQLLLHAVQRLQWLSRDE